jgi:hypothetical protein
MAITLIGNHTHDELSFLTGQTMIVDKKIGFFEIPLPHDPCGTE